MHLFCYTEFSITDYMHICLYDLMGGMKGTIVCMHQSIEDSCNMCKYLLSLGMCIKNASDFYFIYQTKAYITHYFLSWECSLMAQSDNCARLHVNCLEWRDDSIIIYFYHSKVDQEGVNRNDPWKIFKPTISSFPPCA